MNLRKEPATTNILRPSAIFIILSFFFFPSITPAQTHVELTPEISVSEIYDDNLYLDDRDEISDYITEVSPGFTLNILSEKYNLGLLYFPTIVRYVHESDANTVRHLGTITYEQYLHEHLRFDLTNTYLKSEDPLEEEYIAEVRHTRNPYQRNTGSASLSYLFGTENELTAGYRNDFLKNEDETIDDGMIQHPFATMTHWFDIRNGLELNYEYTKAHFWRDDELEPGDDYTGNGYGLRYIYRFTPHATVSLDYNLATRNFRGDDAEEDYKIHDAGIEFEKAFSSDFSITLGGGYFIQENEYSDNEDGYMYDASLTKEFQRGSFSLGGSGGWDESYLTADRTGFIRYWGLETSVDYRFLEQLEGYAGSSYRQNKDEEDIEWDRLTGNCGLRWSFLRWFSLSLDYTYSKRDDDVETDKYTDNRVMLILTASRLYRW